MARKHKVSPTNQTNVTNAPADTLPATLTGVAGEYFVAAELSRLGHIASITLRNTKGVDIIACNQDASKSVAIQVKTNQLAKRGWVMNKKAEELVADNFFYVFVNLKDKHHQPDFHVVPSKVVARYVSQAHSHWLATPGKKGQLHTDHPMRGFADEKGEYLGQWDLLGL